MAVALNFALVIFIMSHVKNQTLTGANSVCYSFHMEEISDIKDWRIISSLWVYNTQKEIHPTQSGHALSILLILAGDVETCPGPKCCMCDKTIRRNQSSGSCSTCGNELHLRCATDRMVDGLEKLYCNQCLQAEHSISYEDSDLSVPFFATIKEFVKTKGLKLFHQNINGLAGKIDSIGLLLKETQGKIDILGLSETHLHKDITANELTIDGFSFIRKDRLNGLGGGVGCYINNLLQWHRREDLECDGIEGLWIEIFIKNSKSILVFILYRPPNTSNYLPRDFNNNFDDTLNVATNEDKETIVVGDVNCNYLNSQNNSEFKNILRDHGFKQIITKPTRLTKDSTSLIDVIATTHEQNILNHITYGSSLSDHELIGAIIKKNCRKFGSRRVFTRNYARYNPTGFKLDLSNLPWEQVFSENSFNNIWSKFKQYLLSVIDKHAPKMEKKIRGRSCPWLTHEIKTKINERDYFLKRARKTGKEVFWSSYRRLRNMVTKLIRHSKANHTRSVLKENINNPRYFWDEIKKVYPTKNSSVKLSSTIIVNGEQSDDKKIIANGFCEYFTNIGKQLQSGLTSLALSARRYSDCLDLRKKLNPTNCQFEFESVSDRYVFGILKRLKRKNSSGHDDIPTSLIVDGAEEIAGPLSRLINISIEESVFPTAEKLAKIIPIYKSEEKRQMGNYRPISILPVLSKVIERVVYEQLYNYLEQNKLLSDKQFGFRRGSSTQHAVTHFSDYIRRNMDKGNMTGAVFIDLQKAFDTVDHAGLLLKLKYYGVDHRELSWFESYLSNRKQFVLYDGTESECQTITCGVPQGSILGPLLFILLINDIDHQLEECEIILYADDTVIFTPGKSCDQIEKVLNADMVRIGEWFNNNNLVVNMKKNKSECILFGTSRKLLTSGNSTRGLNVTINGTTLTETASYKYLGVNMDKNLNFTEHLLNTYKKASTRVKLLARIRHNISPVAAEMIYKSMILPIILYCSNITLGASTTHQTQMENIQRRATRIINTKKNTIKLPPISHLRNKRCVIEVFKCLNGLAPTIFSDYFTKIEHPIGTRGNNTNLILPKVRTETGRKTFGFQGALIYNKLSVGMKQEKSLLRFKTLCNDIDINA